MRKSWRRFYLPFLIATGTMLIGFAIVAYLSSQSLSRVTGFDSPERIALGPNHRVYVSNLGQPGGADGSVRYIEEGKSIIFVTGFEDPKGLAFVGDTLFVADVNRIWQVRADATMKLWLATEDFPQPPKLLNGLAADALGNLFASDSQLGVVFQITPNKEVQVVLSRENGILQTPSDLQTTLDGAVIVADFATGSLIRREANGQVSTLAEGLGSAAGLAQDQAGIFYVSDSQRGRVYTVTPDGQQRVLLQGLRQPTDLVIERQNNTLIISESGANRITLVYLK